MNEKLRGRIFGILMIIIMIWFSIIVLDTQETAICDFCISSNWTGIIRGEIGLQCQKYQFVNYDENITMKEWCEIKTEVLGV